MLSLWSRWGDVETILLMTLAMFDDRESLTTIKIQSNVDDMSNGVLLEGGFLE